MASLPSRWLGSHRREPSLSAPPSGLPPPLHRRTPLPPLRSATGKSSLPEFWSPLPFEVAAGAAAKPIQRPSLFHFLSSGRVLSVACRF
ncbi:uncharacterized protein DS421_19g661450 [Arachis hypogaea]|uniref:Uncharacterized protein n=1 Tax=Arachis hypogaea TaxID=3818 RepID=A0A6B9VE90_ARAHY|nr:uncharacterized protein DS421_19g661450 [Arachis hypogaea]